MVNDEHGIKLLYPSSTTNEQYFALPKSVNILEQSGILAKKVANVIGTFSVSAQSDTILWYEFAPESGNDAKLIFLPSSMENTSDGELVLDVDCDVSHTTLSGQGYVLDSGEWQNIEMTSYVFVKTVDSNSGYLFFEARSGYDGNKGGCCQGTAYGVRLYWDTATANQGKFAFYKRCFTNSTDVLPKQSQSTVVIPSFYQYNMGVKFIIYNSASERVKMELWLTKVYWYGTSDPFSNTWVKVGEVEDYQGRGWSNGGDECDAPSKDYPITWAAPFCCFGWQDARVIQFHYTSVREIDKDGTFGEDPPPTEPPPNFPDPTLPDPNPEPPTTPDPQPPDAEPPLTATTLTKRLTLRREVINNTMCACDGIQPSPFPDDGGEYTVIYNVTPADTYANLGAINSRVGERFLTGSTMVGVTPIRITMRLSNPSSLTGTATLRIRNSSDAIVSTCGTIDVGTIGTTEAGYTITNDLESYVIGAGDRILLEYTHASSNIRIHFHATDAYTNGNRTQYTGASYNTDSSADGDMAWIIYHGEGGGGGGGGGTQPPGGGGGTMSQMYYVPLNTSGFAQLAMVPGNSGYYLRFGQAVTQTSSSWLNKSINRVEITIGKQGLPIGGTGGGIHCRIRKGTDDSIAATLPPVVTPNDVTPEGKLFVFENLTNTYKLAFNDKLLFEFDGGTTTNYIKIFRTTQPTTSGTKIMWQANNMDAGEYDDAPDLDLCARVFTLVP